MADINREEFESTSDKEGSLDSFEIIEIEDHENKENQDEECINKNKKDKKDIDKEHTKTKDLWTSYVKKNLLDNDIPNGGDTETSSASEWSGQLWTKYITTV